MTFKIPTLTCGTQNSEVAIWAGIGGVYKNDPLYKTGIAGFCTAGQATYVGFEQEIRPGKPTITKVATVSVSPDEEIAAAIYAVPSGILMQLYDPVAQKDIINSRPGDFTISAVPKTAECIVEKPTALLANFDNMDTLCNVQEDYEPYFLPEQPVDMVSGGVMLAEAVGTQGVNPQEGASYIQFDKASATG